MSQFVKFHLGDCRDLTKVVIKMNNDIELPKIIFSMKPGQNIRIEAPEIIITELKKHKGDDTWLSLLIDGARYRGSRILFSDNKVETISDKEVLQFNDFIKKILADYPHLLGIFYKLVKSPCSLEIYEYLLWIGKPVTVDDVFDSGVSVSRASVFRAIKNLREMDLVACAGYRRLHHAVKQGGPSPLLWVAI